MDLINRKKKDSIKLSKQEGQQEKANFFTYIKNAAAKMAASAANIPAVGWIIAAAILAALAGIAIAVAVGTEQKDDGLEKTKESLNQIQSDLYNLNSGMQNVRKLGDEFETLSSKIIQSTEDLERLKEIAQQINDQAGRIVVDVNADTETQLNQIRGYQEIQKREYDSKVQEADTTFGKGFDKYASAKSANEAWSDTGENLGLSFAAGFFTPLGPLLGATITTIGNAIEASINADKYVDDLETKQKYIESLGSAGIATIRSVAQQEITALSTYSEKTQEVLKSTYVGMAAELLTESGLDSKKFNKLFDENFAEKLDQTIQTDNIENYYNFVANLSEEQQKQFLKSNSVFAGIYKLGQENVKILQKFGVSMDKVNDA